MKIYLILFVVSLHAMSCNQNDSNQCIDDRIANLGSEICSDGASVKRYTFQGETAYAINVGNCVADYHDLVLDEECDTLGLIGGFGGFSEINGEDFYANATLQETVWQN